MWFYKIISNSWLGGVDRSQPWTLTLSYLWSITKCVWPFTHFDSSYYLHKYLVLGWTKRVYMIGYLGNLVVVHPQFNHKGFPLDCAQLVSSKTHNLAHIVDMIITLGTCNKRRAYTPYKLIYAFSFIVSSMIESNLLHCCYANYWNEKEIPSFNPMGKMKKMNPL